MLRRLFAAAAVTSVAAFSVGAAPQQNERRYINARTAADSALPPFSGAVQIGNTLYLSGDIGLDAANKVPGTAEAEANLLLDRVQKTLADAGYTMDDLVSVQVFCSDVAHYDTFIKVYRSYFKREFP